MEESKKSVYERLSELRDKIAEKKPSTRIGMLTTRSAIKRMDSILIKLKAKEFLDKELMAELESEFKEYDAQYRQYNNLSRETKKQIVAIKKRIKENKKELRELTGSENEETIDGRHAKLASKYGVPYEEEIEVDEAEEIKRLKDEIFDLESKLEAQEEKFERIENTKIRLTDEFEKVEKEARKRLVEAKLNLVMRNEKGNIFKRIKDFFNEKIKEYKVRREARKSEAEAKLKEEVEAKGNIENSAKEKAEAAAAAPGIRERAVSLEQQAEEARKRVLEAAKEKAENMAKRKKGNEEQGYEEQGYEEQGDGEHSDGEH